jgi:hypothetical protein
MEISLQTLGSTAFLCFSREVLELQLHGDPPDLMVRRCEQDFFQRLLPKLSRREHPRLLPTLIGIAHRRRCKISSRSNLCKLARASSGVRAAGGQTRYEVEIAQVLVHDVGLVVKVNIKLLRLV